MANEYYNLAGWLRDVRAVLNNGDDRALTYRAHLYDLFAELVPLEAYGGDDESVPDELESEDADDDVVSTGPRDGSNPRKVGLRPGTERQAPVGRAPRMDNVLPRDVRAEERAAASHALAVARARQAVMLREKPGRIKTAEVQEVPVDVQRNVSRGTSATVRKRKVTPAAKRGKSQTSSRGRGKVRR